ncbi:glycine/sarcosine/betaine reductase selenoprotein B family protein [Thermodesulfobacteriota bacterium]
MVARIRVVHYLNQFFAGVGGEEKADIPLFFSEGPIGPGKRLQTLCSGSAEIVLHTAVTTTLLDIATRFLEKSLSIPRTKILN